MMNWNLEENMKLSRIAGIINGMLKLIILCGTITLFFIHSIVKVLPLRNVFLNTVFFVILGLSCIYIVYEVTKVFKSVAMEHPFIRENEISLKKIAITCEGITLVTFIRLIIDFGTFTITSILIMIIFFIAGLCAYVFSQLFKQSVFLKEENDMTI